MTWNKCKQSDNFFGFPVLLFFPFICVNLEGRRNRHLRRDLYFSLLLCFLIDVKLLDLLFLFQAFFYISKFSLQTFFCCVNIFDITVSSNACSYVLWLCHLFVLVFKLQKEVFDLSSLIGALAFMPKLVSVSNKTSIKKVYQIFWKHCWAFCE